MRSLLLPLIAFVYFCVFHVQAKPKANSEDSGCSINNGSVIVPANTTVADDTWWYLCTGSNWIAKGCVVNGKRYDVGEKFFGYLNEFFGRCEILEGKYIRATVLGCIDVNNQTVDPGHTFIADPLFWANCTATKQSVPTPDVGNVTLDIIGRKIVGCNDGSSDIIPDEGTFVQVTNDGPLQAGVGLVCKIQGSFPQVQPQVCVVANNSDTDEAYIGLADHCFGTLQKFVFYCTIAGEEDAANDTAVYGWEIGWNISTKQFISNLKATGFRDCINEPTKKQQEAGNKLPTKRQKREVREPNFDSLVEEGMIISARVKRSPGSNSFAEIVARSKFTSLRKSDLANIK